MHILRLILGDQLSHNITSLRGCDKRKDIILLVEVISEARYANHHKKKLALIFSAMRHFAQDLIKKGFKVLYTKLEDKNNKGSLNEEVKRICKNYHIDKIIVTHPGEYRVLKKIKQLRKELGISVEILEDSRFLCSLVEFKDWAQKRDQLRLEHFYREMRKRHSILMDDDKPEGRQWNFDRANRKVPESNMEIPKPYIAKSDAVTKEVLKLVSDIFSDHFGDLEPFNLAVTHKQAQGVFNKFVTERLYYFGDYQDAMKQGDPWMYHSHISFYLNIGLLDPFECIKKVEKAYYENKVPINSAEGFIRQILGWREFIRGIYWLNMPHYAEHNFLHATRKLPALYWSGDTTMNCMKQCIHETKQNAYAHHIQRLMVLGNFALITAIDPREVSFWYLSVYADAYEWVEMPNVMGMILYADGGYLASKPYASGGAYINKMSNYCKKCSYDVRKKNGTKACPFNYLYWNFIDENRDSLQNNPRMAMMYKIYDRMDNAKKTYIKQDAQKFLSRLT